MLLTTPQAAKRLGVSRQRVSALIKAGLLAAEMIGRDWLIHDDVLEEFAARHRPRGRPRGSMDCARRAYCPRPNARGKNRARQTPRPPIDGCK